MKTSIEENQPVLVPVSYHKLFYYLAYNEKGNHMLIINGYDEERKLLLIIDCNVVEHELELRNPDYTLYQLALTEDIFRDIW